jgi:hypothetical protein
MSQESSFRAGDWVVVRSKEEILETLDRDGRLDGLPFMPQMFQYCGTRLQVFKSAHKTCDTIDDSGKFYKSRKMKDAVHLDGIRCDGLAYGGCEAACLLYWKHAWLRRANSLGSDAGRDKPKRSVEIQAVRSEQDVYDGTKAKGKGSDAAPVYVCQATEVPAATQPLPWWEPWQYLKDFASGNVGLGRMFQGFAYMGYQSLVNAGIGLGRPLRFLYDGFQQLRGGAPYPRRIGKIPAGTKTPTVNLNLAPGDLVRVKSYCEILETLDQGNRNRGLYFDAEMVPYCGRVFRVLKRVRKIVNEKTGVLQELKTPCIVLEGVVCQSRYSECRLFCPRSIYAYWREIWLERVLVEGDPSQRRHEPTAAPVRATSARSATVGKTL